MPLEMVGLDQMPACPRYPHFDPQPDMAYWDQTLAYQAFIYSFRQAAKYKYDRFG